MGAGKEDSCSQADALDTDLPQLFHEFSMLWFQPGKRVWYELAAADQLQRQQEGPSCLQGMPLAWAALHVAVMSELLLKLYLMILKLPICLWLLPSPPLPNSS
jgi:hypothetical protein